MASAKNIDLRLLECLDVLVRESNVTLAANCMGISQGNMSNSLARLREIFQDPILVRTSRGMMPTDRAIVLRSEAREAIRHLGDMLGLGEDEELIAVDRVVRIASADAAALAIIAPKIKMIKAAAPKLHLQITQILNTNFQEALSEGSLDLVIGAYDSLPDTLQISRVAVSPMRCAVSAHSSFSRKGIAIDEYCSVAHAMLIYGYGWPATMETVTDAALSAIGKERNIRLSSQYGSVIMDAVSNADFIATMPDIVIDQLCRDGSVKSIDVPIKLPDLTLSMLWHPRSKPDKLLSWIRSCLRDQSLKDDAMNDGN